MKEATLELRDQIRALLVETLMLPVSAAEITDDRPLFGPGGLGLDSVDALQLVVALDKTFGLKLTDVEVARKALHTVNSIAGAIGEYRQVQNP
ncbi:MAG: acyl carrier protein [Burkholderiaceae bacterium]|nr:acyl carrier protein [Burkholderiaceae bacterium]